MKRVLFVLLALGLMVSAGSAKGIQAGSMLPAVSMKYGGLGLGYGASFEYGITDRIGAKASLEMSSYEAGTLEWSLVPIDLAATYMWDDTKYGLLGVTFTSFSVSDTFFKKDDSASSFGLVGGAGYRYDLTGNLQMNFEGRYRLITMETDSYKLVASWYTLGLELVYSL